MSTEAGRPPAYRADKAALQKRLRRIEGLVRGVELEDHAQQCVIGAEADRQEERTTELMGAVRRLLRHG